MLRNFQEEMSGALGKKTDKSEMLKVWNQFKSYALYQDLKDLYAKVLPPLSTFEEKMDEMSASYEQSKEVIRRYDEIISDKASKTSIKELYEYVRRFIETKKVTEI
jgi:hypothetical protein